MTASPWWMAFSLGEAALVAGETWAMMLFGFAGLGLAGYRASRKALPIAA